MKINVDGVFYATRAALPHLLQSKGSIVNVSSVSGLGGDWYQSFYNASKGAVSNLTRSLSNCAARCGGQCCQSEFHADGDDRIARLTSTADGENRGPDPTGTRCEA